MQFISSLKIFLFLFVLLFLLGIWGCKSRNNNIDEADSATGTSSDADSETEVMPKVTTALQNKTVFAEDKILEYHVTIADQLMAELDDNGIEEKYKEASLRVTGAGIEQTFEKVGIRYKGAGSLNACWEGGQRNYDGYCARISMKLKFNKYDKDARYYGLKKLNLHSTMDDATLMRERLGYSLFTDAGVISPRSAHTKLYINGKLTGLYIAVEVIDGRFTHFHFPDSKDGNLYKEIWPGPNVTESRALEQLETNNNEEDNPDVSDFLQFKDAITKTTEANFAGAVAPWLDLDNLIRYFAVDRALRNWDGIMGFYSADTSHNFFWYYDKGATNRFVLIPWDMDTTMGEFDIAMNPQGWCDATPIPNWNMTPLNCDERPTCMNNGIGMTPPRCDHLIDMLAKTQWTAFTQMGNDLLSDVLSYDSMNAKITKWKAQITDAVEADPLLSVEQWTADLKNFQTTLQEAIFDFKDHMEQGLIAEMVPTAREESTLVSAIVPGGLRPAIINNFEFENGTENVLEDWLYGISSSDTTLAIRWNTESPITGTADILLSADFTSVPGAWNEWASVQFTPAQVTDISEYNYLWFSAKANADTKIRLEFGSSAYAEYGDIYQMFSKEFNITTESSFFYIDLKKLSYPKWAKDEWNEGEGWAPPDNEARKNILSHLSTLGIQLIPARDTTGEMFADTELVTIQLDNIYFE